MTTTTSRAIRLGPALRPTEKVLPEHARAHNRSLVLAHLFHSGPTSRADIARSTGLTRVTVSDLVAELIGENLVAELGVRVGGGRVGKPATLVGMQTEAFHIVAVDLTDDAALTGAVMTLASDVVARRTAALDGRTGDEAVAVLEGLCRDLLAAATQPVIGIGIGSPGVIDADGVVLEAPNRGWFGVPLAARLQAALGVPVHVANDANVQALGEYLRQHKVTDALSSARGANKSPVAKVMESGLTALLQGREALKTEGPDDVGDFDLVDSVNRALERVKERETSNLRRGLSFLGTVASATPFIGLLGTVVGILGTFQLLKGGSVTINEIGPKISEALVSTALGLGIAIIGAMSFNFFTSRVEQFVIDMNDVSSEFIDYVLREGRG